MILKYKNKEYCLTDWKLGYNADMYLRYLIEPIMGIVDKSSYIALLEGRLGWYLVCMGEFSSIYDIHKEIFPNYSIGFDNLKQGQEDIDRFLLRIDNIKIFI